MSTDATKTWDPQRLKRDRLRMLQDEMKLRDIAALYLSDQTNVRYALDQHVPGGEVFVPADGEALGLVRGRDMGYVTRRHANVRPPFYDRSALRGGTDPEQAARFVRGIRELMDEHGGGGGQIAFDALPVDPLLALVAAEVRVVDADPLMEHVVTVKTPDEVTIYRTVSEIEAHAIGAFRDALRPGVTENELAGLVVTAWHEAGGEDIAQLNICAGENMNPWVRWPTDRPLKEGEFVGIDIHGRGPSGLRGDTSRTFFVGRAPSAEQRDLYRRAHEYITGAVAEFRAGRSYSEVLEALPPIPEQYHARFADYNPGHGVGMGNSGFPKINQRRRGANEDLKVNQMLAIECYFGEVGSPQAVKLEEVICVRDGPPEVMTALVPYDEALAP